MRRGIFSALAIAPLAVLAAAPSAAAAGEAAADGTADVTGTIGVRVDDHGSYIAMRYVGEPAPAGYDDSYQHGEPYIITASPEDGPVTITGTLDLTDLEKGEHAAFGLYDADALRAGDSAHRSDNAFFVARIGDEYRIGVTDGNAGGGEVVQRFTDFAVDDLQQPIAVEFVVDGTADPATCASHAADIATADGCLTLKVNGELVAEDSYGTLSPDGASDVELANGAHPGWWAGGFPESEDDTGTGVDYQLDITPTVLAGPEACKDGAYAHFGFRNQGQCVASLRADDHAGQ